MTLNDAHCHFFSARFFETLARETTGASAPQHPPAAHTALGWEPPGTPEQLADRWVGELNRHQVERAAIIASVPGDEDSVAAALAAHPESFVGFFMLNPLAEDAVGRTRRALGPLGLRGVCLFPAMHRYSLLDPRVGAVLEVAAAMPGSVVFVHCGVLSVGARKRLGLSSRFEARLGHPLDVQALAATWPALPFIIPHFGAGLFREALMAADMCPNVYLDTSSSNAWLKYNPGLTLAEVYRHALLIAGPERLLFGTDSSFFPRGWQRGIFDAQMAAMQTVNVRNADADLILGGNFNRLFPLLPADTRVS